MAYQSETGHAISDITLPGLFVTLCWVLIAARAWASATVPVTA